MHMTLLILAGAGYVGIVIFIVRLVARRFKRIKENWVYSLTLALTAWNYVAWARAGGGTTSQVQAEWFGFGFFTVLALLGLRWAPVLAIGWLLHPAWDVILHPIPGTNWVPSWFPALCVGFDLVLGVYIVRRWTAARRVPAASPAQSPETPGGT